MNMQALTIITATGSADSIASGNKRHTLADTLVCLRVSSSSGRSEDEEPQGLPDTSDDQRPTATELQRKLEGVYGITSDETYLLHNVHAAERADEVDRAEDDLGDKRILNADRRKDGGTIL